MFKHSTLVAWIVKQLSQNPAIVDAQKNMCDPYIRQDC